jgi:hypothetical protein
MDSIKRSNGKPNPVALVSTPVARKVAIQAGAICDRSRSFATT